MRPLFCFPKKKEWRSVMGNRIRDAPSEQEIRAAVLFLLKKENRAAFCFLSKPIRR